MYSCIFRKCELVIRKIEKRGRQDDDEGRHLAFEVLKIFLLHFSS